MFISHGLSDRNSHVRENYGSHKKGLRTKNERKKDKKETNGRDKIN